MLLCVYSVTQTPWTVAHQAPLSMEFFRQEYWCRLTFPSPGDVPDPGIKPPSPASAGGFFTTELPRKSNTRTPLFHFACPSHSFNLCCAGRSLSPPHLPPPPRESQYIGGWPLSWTQMSPSSPSAELGVWTVGRGPLPLLGGKGTQQPPVGQADRWCKCQRIMELWRVSVGIKRNDEHHISDDVSSPGYLCLL